mmetsp:Transcript_8582/g.14473  ORF Transcript_8582/g.14473 Transcript_8582/m.14473 type:complete len:770 (+) Transcript_8582:1612-3921(+)
MRGAVDQVGGHDLLVHVSGRSHQVHLRSQLVQGDLDFLTHEGGHGVVEPHALHCLEEQDFHQELKDEAHQELQLPLDALLQSLQEHEVDEEAVQAQQQASAEVLLPELHGMGVLELLAELLSEDAGSRGVATKQVHHEQVKHLEAGVVNTVLTQVGAEHRGLLGGLEALLREGDAGHTVDEVQVRGVGGLVLEDAPLGVEQLGLVGVVVHQHTLLQELLIEGHTRGLAGVDRLHGIRRLGRTQFHFLAADGCGAAHGLHAVQTSGGLGGHGLGGHLGLQSDGLVLLDDSVDLLARGLADVHYVLRDVAVGHDLLGDSQAVQEGLGLVVDRLRSLMHGHHGVSCFNADSGQTARAGLQRSVDCVHLGGLQVAGGGGSHDAEEVFEGNGSNSGHHGGEHSEVEHGIDRHRLRVVCASLVVILPLAEVLGGIKGRHTIQTVLLVHQRLAGTVIAGVGHVEEDGQQEEHEGEHTHGLENDLAALLGGLLGHELEDHVVLHHLGPDAHRHRAALTEHAGNDTFNVVHHDSLLLHLDVLVSEGFLALLDFGHQSFVADDKDSGSPDQTKHDDHDNHSCGVGRRGELVRSIESVDEVSRDVDGGGHHASGAGVVEETLFGGALQLAGLSGAGDLAQALGVRGVKIDHLAATQERKLGGVHVQLGAGGGLHGAERHMRTWELAGVHNNRIGARAGTGKGGTEVLGDTDGGDVQCSRVHEVIARIVVLQGELDGGQVRRGILGIHGALRLNLNHQRSGDEGRSVVRERTRRHGDDLHR